MEKRYQVFVSSTYGDLKIERQRVIQALLAFNCIPVGMEFFPAADDSTWDVIQRVIEECDYYIVIVAGKYGSVTPEGISYTEKEYKYAVEKGIPVCAFLHSEPDEIPAGKTELGEDSRVKLEEFRNLCRQKMCKSWTTADEVAGNVVMSLIQLTKTRPAVGWVRADQIADETATKEILQLRDLTDKLKKKLARLDASPPENIADLSQGEDRFGIEFTYSGDDFFDIVNFLEFTWNDIFSTIAPTMLKESPEYILKRTLEDFIKWNARDDIMAQHHSEPTEINIRNDTFLTIIIQLRALGLIDKSGTQKSLKDTVNYWQLTPHGDSLMTKIMAVKKS